MNTIVPENAVETLHEATLQLLETVGVAFGDEEALALFKKHGFRVEENWVTFTQAQIEAALAACPASFTIHGLDSAACFGGGVTNFTPCSGAVELYDEGTYRALTEADLRRRIQLDAVSEVHQVCDMDVLHVPDLPTENQILYKAALTLRYNPKPLITNCSTGAYAGQTLQLARDFYDDEHQYHVIGIGNMISPLKYTAENIAAMTPYAAYGQPLVIACCSVPGVTSPVTLSGTLVQNNAEILAGIVYMQLLRPGLPLVYGNSTFGVNMRDANTSCGAFEAALLIPYTAALARYYHLPSRVSGSLTDAKAVDYQAGAETAVGLFYAINSGVDLVYHSCGGLDGLMRFSFAKYLLDEEILMRLLHAADHDMLHDLAGSMTDLLQLREGVNYLTSRQTFTEFKKEHYNIRLGNRERFAQWQKSGSPTVEQKALQALEQRLAQYSAPELDARQQHLLNAILEG